MPQSLPSQPFWKGSFLILLLLGKEVLAVREVVGYQKFNQSFEDDSIADIRDQLDEHIMSSVNSAVEHQNTEHLAKAFRQAGLSTLCHVVANPDDSSPSSPEQDADLKAMTSLASDLNSMKTTVSDDHQMLVDIKAKLDAPAAKGQKRSKFMKSTGGFAEKFAAGCKGADPAIVILATAEFASASLEILGELKGAASSLPMVGAVIGLAGVIVGLIVNHYKNQPAAPEPMGDVMKRVVEEALSKQLFKELKAEGSGVMRELIVLDSTVTGWEKANSESPGKAKTERLMNTVKTTVGSNFLGRLSEWVDNTIKGHDRENLPDLIQTYMAVFTQKYLLMSRVISLVTQAYDKEAMQMLTEGIQQILIQMRKDIDKWVKELELQLQYVVDGKEAVELTSANLRGQPHLYLAKTFGKSSDWASYGVLWPNDSRRAKLTLYRWDDHGRSKEKRPISDGDWVTIRNGKMDDDADPSNVFLSYSKSHYGTYEAEPMGEGLPPKTMRWKIRKVSGEKGPIKSGDEVTFLNLHDVALHYLQWASTTYPHGQESDTLGERDGKQCPSYMTQATHNDCSRYSRNECDNKYWVEGGKKYQCRYTNWGFGPWDCKTWRRWPCAIAAFGVLVESEFPHSHPEWARWVIKTVPVNDPLQQLLTQLKGTQEKFPDSDFTKSDDGAKAHADVRKRVQNGDAVYLRSFSEHQPGNCPFHGFLEPHGPQRYTKWVCEWYDWVLMLNKYSCDWYGTEAYTGCPTDAHKEAALEITRLDNADALEPIRHGDIVRLRVLRTQADRENEYLDNFVPSVNSPKSIIDGKYHHPPGVYYAIKGKFNSQNTKNKFSSDWRVIVKTESDVEEDQELNFGYNVEFRYNADPALVLCAISKDGNLVTLKQAECQKHGTSTWKLAHAS